MARYGAVWVEIALEQYLTLTPGAREVVDIALERLLERPRDEATSYDQRSDQRTAIYGDGDGLIVYAVVPERDRIVVLRLV